MEARAGKGGGGVVWGGTALGSAFLIAKRGPTRKEKIKIEKEIF